MEQDNKRLADIWLLISTLNTARYAITEINPDTMQSHTKMQFKNLKTNIENFLISSQSKMQDKDRKKLAEINFENVAIMAETMSLLAHVPINKQEEFLQGVNELVFKVVEEDKNASEQ
jgi:hypothetical protein